MLPPADAYSRSIVQNYIADAGGGLPEAETFPTRGYRPKLSLDYISQPQVGVGTDPYYNSGFGIAGGISFLFSDQLSDNVLGLAVAAHGTFKDIGGQALYLNRADRLTYGAIAGHIPYLQVFIDRPPEGSLDVGVLTRYYYRTYVTQVSGLTSYPLNQSQRFEAEVGYRRHGYDLEYDSFFQTDGGNLALERRPLEGFSPDPLHLGQGGVAYVGDTRSSGSRRPSAGPLPVRRRPGGGLAHVRDRHGRRPEVLLHAPAGLPAPRPGHARRPRAPLRPLRLGLGLGPAEPALPGQPPVGPRLRARSFDIGSAEQFDDYLSRSSAAGSASPRSRRGSRCWACPSSA